MEKMKSFNEQFAEYTKDITDRQLMTIGVLLLLGIFLDN